MTDDKEDNGEPSSKRKRDESRVRTRPNFFAAVQVSSPQIHREVNRLQKLITSKKPIYKSVLINIITLHITLCTLYLAGNKDIKRAKTALKKLEFDTKEAFERYPLSLKFKGIGSFKNEVVFAKIEPGEPLTRITNLHGKLVEALREEGLVVTHKFNPHLTVMKMSKDWTLRKKKVFKIPRELYKDNDEMEFGDQRVRGVQLLRMGQRPNKSYYSCYHHLDLGLSHTEEEEHEECCGVKSVFPDSVVEMNAEFSDEDIVAEEVFSETTEKSTTDDKKRTKRRKHYEKTLWKKDVKLETQIQKTEEKSICDRDKNLNSLESDFVNEFRVFEGLFPDNEQEESQIKDENLSPKSRDFKNGDIKMKSSVREESIEAKNEERKMYDEIEVIESIDDLPRKNEREIFTVIRQVEKSNFEAACSSAENTDSESGLCEEFKMIDPIFGSEKVKKSTSQEDGSLQDLEINAEIFGQRESKKVPESEKNNQSIKVSKIETLYVNTEEAKNNIASEEFGKEIYYYDGSEIMEDKGEIKETNVKDN